MRTSATRNTVLCCSVVALAYFVSPVLGQIPWRSGKTPVARKSVGELRAALDALSVTGSVTGKTRHMVVEFDKPMTQADRVSLAASGVTLLRYLGANAYFASVSATKLNTDALVGMRSLRDIKPVVKEWKMSPWVQAGSVPEWAVVAGDPISGGASPADGAVDRVVALYVLFHPDVLLDSAGVGVAVSHGATVRSLLESVNGLVIELPQASITALVEEDAVQWVEWPLPQLSVTNNNNRARSGADIVQAVPYSLDGSGVTVMVYDGGIASPTHPDFENRLIIGDSTSIIGHSTHVAGTIGAAGVVNLAYRGMAPGVTLVSYGIGQAGGPSDELLYSNPGDMEADTFDAISSYDAALMNMSLGANVAQNNYPCEWEGDYGVTSVLIDTMVRGDGSNPLFTEPFRMVVSNGNERWTGRCGSTYNTIAPPAGAKNHITVGALNSNDETMTAFSSWGPTDDGRLKPDIAGPGCQNTDDLGVTSTSPSGGYFTICGTSMAAPTVTGCSALLLEDFRDQRAGSADPRNSTLKSLLTHSAVDVGATGPDYQTGYGSMRVPAAIDLQRAGKALENVVSQGGVYSFQYTVGSGDPQLKITLAWDDVPGTPNVSPSLVNDLDLRVFDPLGVQHYPWTLDPANPANPAVRTQADHLNNIEQVLVDNPAEGVWTVEVYGFNVPVGPQTFSLVGDGVVNVGTLLWLPNGLPDPMPAETATPILVNITTTGENYVPGSGLLHYRYSGGLYQTVPLLSLGGDAYQAMLPATGCSSLPEFYFSAQSTVSGVNYQPFDAPATVFTNVVGTLTAVLGDDFETDKGWTVVNLGVTAGNWERGVPINDPNWIFDPTSDSDGSGQCYLTQNTPGNSDVDGGATQLISPVIDMSAGNASINYDYFLRIADEKSTDALVVEITSNGVTGPWTVVAWHDTDGGLSWRSNSITQAKLDNVGFVLGPTVQVRFTINDANPSSIVEAGIDAFAAVVTACQGNGDFDEDGDVDLADFNVFQQCFGQLAAWGCDAGDMTGDGMVDMADVDAFASALAGPA